MRLMLVVVVGWLTSAAPGGAQVVPDPSEAPMWRTAARGRGTPAVLGDRAFATTLDHDVVALSVADGHELWRQSTGESGRFTEGQRILAANDLAVVGDWDVYAFRASSGERAWAFHPTDGYGPGLFLGQTVDGRVFTGSPSGSLYALDLATGRPLWRAVVNNDVLTSVYEPATNGRVVAATYTEFGTPNTAGVVGVDAVTGRERWRVRFPAPDDGSPSTYAAGGVVMTDTLVFASSAEGYVWAIDVDTGHVRWKIPPLAGPFSGIITKPEREFRSLGIVQDRLIVGSVTGYLVAYDLHNQREAWRVEKGWLGSIGLDDFVSADGIVYVNYASGFLLAIDGATGEVLWQTDDYTKGLVWPPAVLSDRVIATGATGVWALPTPRTRAKGHPQ